MGAALGLVLEIGAYVLFSLAGLREVLWLWPVLVIVPFVAMPTLRRHWLPRDYRQRVPLLWSWTLAAVAVFLLGYVAYAYLEPNWPLPGVAGRVYFNDQLYLLSLVGEAKHHFPLESPQVAGIPLRYHWFAYGHVASASLISGVDTPVVFFRLAVPAFALFAVVLLGVAGWRVSGKPWVGAVASALMFAVGELAVGSVGTGPLGAVTAFVVWNGQSLPYSWLMIFPLIVFVLDRLVGGLTHAPIGRGAWIGVVLFALAAPGAKATILPVTFCALGLVAVVELTRRRPRRNTWLLVALVLAAQFIGLAVLYHFESQGLRIGSGLSIFYSEFRDDNRAWWQTGLLYLALIIGYLAYMLTRLAGVPVLARIRGQEWGTTEWFLLGGVVGGTVATVVLGHQSLSQNNFVRAGFAFGAILSAMGLVGLVERHRLSTRTMTVVAAATLGLGVATSFGMWKLTGRGPTFAVLNPIFRAALATAVVAAGIAVVLTAARRRWPSMRGVAGVAVLTFVLGAGLPTLAWDAYLHPNGNGYYHTAVNGEQVRAARWLRENSDPDDLVATNVHCVSRPPEGCAHLNFYLSAYSERRFLVASWAYEQRVDELSSQTGQFPPGIPFWDTELIAMNDAAITAPDAHNLDYVYGKGVRWIVVDRAYGRESGTLRDLADLPYQTDQMAVYHLRPPRSGGESGGP
jgi:hypothetical protein